MPTLSQLSGDVVSHLAARGKETPGAGTLSKDFEQWLGVDDVAD